MEENNNKKDIEVVQGIGNLDISPVYENITSAKPKMQDEKPKNIVIPQVKKPVEKEEKVTIEDNNDDDNSDNQPNDEIQETLNDIVEEDELDNIENSPSNDESEIAEGEQIEFEDIDLDDDIDEADKYNEEDG